jgi:NADH:ubiquinone oxidoreductase subunit D
MTLNLGPQHPSTHGVLRLIAKVDGERVEEIEPVIGYMHRGYEKRHFGFQRGVTVARRFQLGLPA